MNTAATADRREREQERSEAHGATWPTRRRSHRLLWAALLAAVIAGIAVVR